MDPQHQQDLLLLYKVPHLVHVHTKINSLYTEFHFLQVLLRLLIPCMSHIFTSAMNQHWKLQLSILPSSLSGFMTSATPTHQRAYNVQVPPTSERFSRLKTAYGARNRAPKEAEEPYLCPFVSKWPSQCQPRLFYSQPSQQPCAQHPVLKPAHLPLSHHFCQRKTYLQNGLRQLITCG